MTAACHAYEPLLAEHLFGELDSASRQRLAAHLAGCPACRAELAELEAAVEVAAAAPRPEPDAAYWRGYDARLAARLAREDRPAWPARLAAWWRQSIPAPAPAWHLQLAGAVALLVVGVGLGWLLFAPSADESPRFAGVAPAMPVEAAALEARTERYLERSKVLLLGLVNMEPGAAGDAPLDLSRRQAVARSLVAEADTLRGALSPKQYRALLALLDDLEVILVQIANLEAGYDVPAIEMVQRGVERRGLLLKIDLTALSRADDPSHLPETP